MRQEAVFTVAHNVVHLRAKPSNDSEQVSQALMGQRVLALREENGWAYVEGQDTYRGWADKRWLSPLTDVPLTFTSAVFTEVRAAPDADAPLLVRLPVLSGVKRETETSGDWTKASLTERKTVGWLLTSALEPLKKTEAEFGPQMAAQWGHEFLGTPYLWGGSSSFGLDCSGFVQLCYQLAGIILRRDADIQHDDPRFFQVGPDARRAGDLVFFGKPDRITHVGMHLAGNTFIHAAGGAGVIVTEWGEERYSPSYVDARRLDPKRAAEPITRFEADDR